MPSKSDSVKRIRSAVTSFDIEEAANVNLEIVKTLGNVTSKLDQKDNRENKQLTELIEELRYLPRHARAQRIHEEKMFSSMIKLIAGYEKKAKLETDTDKKNALLEAATGLRKEAQRLVRIGGGARPENLREVFAEKVLKISPKMLREAGGSIPKAYRNEFSRMKNFMLGRKGQTREDVVNKAVDVENKTREVTERFGKQITPAIQETQADAGLPVDKPLASGKTDAAPADDLNKGKGPQVLDTAKGLVEVDEAGNTKPLKKSRSKKSAKAEPAPEKATGTAIAQSVDGSPILGKIYDEVRAIRLAIAQPRDAKGRFKKMDDDTVRPSDKKKIERIATKRGLDARKGAVPKIAQTAVAEGEGAVARGVATVEKGAMAVVELGQRSLSALTDAFMANGPMIATIVAGAVATGLVMKAAKGAKEAASAWKNTIKENKANTSEIEEKAGMSYEEAKERIEARRKGIAPPAAPRPKTPATPAVPPTIDTGSKLEKLAPSTTPPPPVILQPITNNNNTTPPTPAPRQTSSGGVRTTDPAFLRHEDKRQNRTLSA